MSMSTVVTCRLCCDVIYMYSVFATSGVGVNGIVGHVMDMIYYYAEHCSVQCICM